MVWKTLIIAIQSTSFIEQLLHVDKIGLLCKAVALAEVDLAGWTPICRLHCKSAWRLSLVIWALLAHTCISSTHGHGSVEAIEILEAYLPCWGLALEFGLHSMAESINQPCGYLHNKMCVTEIRTLTLMMLIAYPCIDSSYINEEV